MTHSSPLPSKNPAFATAKGRQILVGLQLDEALRRTRGYNIDVVQSGENTRRFHADRVTLCVSRDDVVEEVV